MSAKIYQHVNLYQPIFRRQRQIFSAATMLGIICVVALGLLAVYGYGRWHTRALELEAERLEQREQAFSERLASIDSGAGNEARRELEAELERLNDKLAAQHKLLDALRDEPLSDSDGFSPQLAALARAHRDGVWLTELAIDGTTGAVELAGRALSADRVAAYLKLLSRESELSGKRFELMRIERSDEHAGVDFRVSSPSAMSSRDDETLSRRAP